MDFDWSEDQAAFAEVVHRFAERELAGPTTADDTDGVFDREAWKRCAAFGIQGLPFDREHGGGGADLLTVVAAMEALGRGCSDNGLLFSLNAHMWAVEHPIARFGTPEQRERWLPGLFDGSLIGAHGMSEPGSGSDAFSLTTSAAATDDGWVLNGSKIFVSNAPVADLFLVFATTDRTKGFGAVNAFVVERDTPGLTLGAPLHKLGLRTSPMSEVFLDDCVVPAANHLGRRGGGMPIFASSMERERSMILACTLGTMARDLDRCIEHARSRTQFGQPIGKFQAVSHRVVEMKLRLETARLLMYRLAWMIDNGRSVALESSLVKLHLSECFVASSLDAVRLFGGYGYMEEYGLSRDLRDAVGSALYSGTSDIQRNLAARHLLGL